MSTRKPPPVAVPRSPQPAIGRVGPVRMEDVARQAGVSLVTVSRAVNQPDRLAPKTLAQVRAAIAQLGFVPNLTAGSLASRRSRIIAAIVPTIAHSIFADTVDGLSGCLAAAGYQLLLGQTQYRSDEELLLVDTFLGRRVDGLVLTGVDHTPAVRQRLARAAIPVVETWDLSDAPIDMLVGFSNEAAGAAAANHLIGRGYRRLGFIGGDEPRSSRRFEGFCRIARDHGLPAVVRHRVPVPSAYLDSGGGLAPLLKQSPGLQAVFCANDMLAAAVLFECQRQRIAVPQQLAVMGFADLPIAQAIEPTLTSVRVHAHEIGLRSAQLLLARLLPGHDEAALRVDLGFAVMERAST